MAVHRPTSEKDINEKDVSSLVIFLLPDTLTHPFTVVGSTVVQDRDTDEEYKEGKGLVMRLSLEMCLSCPTKCSIAALSTVVATSHMCLLSP